MEQVAINPWAALAYLVAGVCFILALRGLSSPVSSQRGNRFGMIGMAIAVVTTLVTHIPVINSVALAPHFGVELEVARTRLDTVAIAEILAAIALGAAIGIVTARRIAMPGMPSSSPPSTASSASPRCWSGSRPISTPPRSGSPTWSCR